MINEIPDGNLLAEKCLRALGSLHCELPPREKRVLRLLVNDSFAMGRDGAMYGSSEQIALLAEVNKWDVSHALASLRRNRLIRAERANALHPFKRPMLYFVDPHALVRVAQKPPLGHGAAATERLRADTAKWLAHANRCYPLQPDLIPPDLRELDLALAEISRASVLADDLPQNGEPKPEPQVAGEAYPPEQGERPGLTTPPSESPLDADYVKVGQELGLSPAQIARLARQKLAAGEPVVVGNSPTTKAPSWKFSNYSCARDQMSSDSDVDNQSTSGNPEGDARGLVGEFPTTESPGFAVQAGMLLAKFGEEWTPPTAAEAVLAELTKCMGAAAMANYTPWWWPRCVDPVSRIDVIETIAEWKLKRHGRKFKPWRGGNWRDEYHRRQRARLAVQQPNEIAS